MNSRLHQLAMILVTAATTTLAACSTLPPAELIVLPGKVVPLTVPRSFIDSLEARWRKRRAAFQKPGQRSYESVRLLTGLSIHTVEFCNERVTSPSPGLIRHRGTLQGHRSMARFALVYAAEGAPLDVVYGDLRALGSLVRWPLEIAVELDLHPREPRRVVRVRGRVILISESHYWGQPSICWMP